MRGHQSIPTVVAAEVAQRDLKTLLTANERFLAVPWVRAVFFIGLAFFFTSVTTARFPAWFLNGEEEIDSWFYWAIGPAHGYLSEHLSQTYYFRRWTLNIPNYVFQNLFPPMEAQLFLRGTLLILVLVLSGLLVNMLTKSIVASVSTMAVVSNSTLLLSGIGRSLHEGTGLVFFLIVSLMFVHLYRTGLSNSRAIFIAGLAFGILFVTYQFTIVILLAMVLAFVIARSPLHFRELAKAGLTFVFGFLTISLVDLAVGWAQGGWGEILTTTFFEWGSIRMSGQHSPDLPGYFQNFFFSADNFLLPMAGLGLVMISSTGKRQNLWSIFLVTAAFVYFALPLIGMAGAETGHVAVYGLLAALVGSGVALSNLIDQRFGAARIGIKSELQKLIFMLALVIVAALVPNEAWLLLIVSGSCLFISGLFLKRLSRFSPTSEKLKSGFFLACAIVLSIALLSSGLSFSNQLPKRVDQSRSEISTRLTNLHNEVHALSEYGLRTGYRMFFIDNRPHKGWSQTISSFYGMYSSIAEGFPAPPIDCRRMDYVLSQERPLVVLLHDSDDVGAKAFVSQFFDDCGDIVVRYVGEVPGVSASGFEIVRP